MLSLFLALTLAHLVADFFLQNDWMVTRKTDVRSMAGYVHAALHGGTSLLACHAFGLGWPLAVCGALALVHWIIDLRVGLASWRAFYRQTTDPRLPHAPAFFMLQDQAAHGIVIVLACLLSR